MQVPLLLRLDTRSILDCILGSSWNVVQLTSNLFGCQDPPQDPDPLCLLNMQVKAQKSAVLAGAGAQVAAEVHPAGSGIMNVMATVDAVKWRVATCRVDTAVCFILSPLKCNL
ncbi:hypothetical protein LIER_10697 [Lithospermum erythrorhizon]|uniref:Uncharacterized protein n=1 Tax=Lithospermum erythrorhizon TaxID=34254 RepID=A0AAV3PKB5_LITER